MSPENNLELRVAEEYGKALAILETLRQVAEKIKEDPSKRGPKIKTSLTDMKIQFSGVADGLVALRGEVDSLLERGVLVTKDVTNIDQAIKKLGSLRTKLDTEEISKADCSRWIDDLEAIQAALERRYQIKKVDSEKQASVISLTEQLRQKDTQIEQLNAKVQLLQAQINPEPKGV